MKSIIFFYFLVLSPLLFCQNGAHFVMYESNMTDNIEPKIRLSDFKKNNITILDRDFVTTGNEDLLTSSGEIKHIKDDFSSFLLIKQLEELDDRSPLNIVHNPTLERFIRHFLKNRRSSLQDLMGRSTYYFPMIEEYLDKYDLPLEIKYLAIVESALKPKAISSSGAKGLWQFMLATGKQYNLTVDSYVDDRYDPIRSTEAACKYLGDLYDMFEDWDLALAAYNSGPGNVRKAIRRAGGKTNYWEIRRFLPIETRSYVPAFYATYYIFEYSKEHQLTPSENKLTYFEVDTIQMKRAVSLQKIQKNINISLELLRALNPQYKKDYIPHSKSQTNILTLPSGYVDRFIQNEDAIYMINGKDVKSVNSFSLEITEYNSHLVTKGENLNSIALLYNISLNQLKKWNGLETDYLIHGQRLVITDKKQEKLKIQNKDTPYNNNAITNPFSPKVSPNFSIKSARIKDVSSTKNYIIYEVKDGDTLFNISRKFQGITIEELRSWNDLSQINYLRPGTKLKIFKS